MNGRPIDIQPKFVKLPGDAGHAPVDALASILSPDDRVSTGFYVDNDKDTIQKNVLKIMSRSCLGAWALHILVRTCLIEHAKLGVLMESTQSAFSKLPAITLAFWVMKIVATTLGDFLSKGPEHAGINLGYLLASIIVLGIFFATLIPQLLSKRFHPFLYWSVILATSTAGTTMSDFMDRTIGVGYAMGSAILIGLLITVLIAWRLVEGSISVGSIRSRRAEIFYWIAILCSNTLGTALGDCLADEEQGPGLGFLGGSVDRIHHYDHRDGIFDRSTNECEKC